MIHENDTTKVPSSVNDKIKSLLISVGKLTDMPVILHDYLAMTRLPRRLREHLSEACLAKKAADKNKSCAFFCGAGGEINTWIEKYPDGRVHACPHGGIKLAVPLISKGLLAGVLHGGPVSSKTPEKESRGRKRLNHCLVLLGAVAREIERLVLPWQLPKAREESRTTRVLEFLNTARDRPARLEELAGHLHLSPSRTRHLVRELFGKSFSALSLQIRLQRAAGLLTLTDRSLGGITYETGFFDQSHFTRSFKKHFGLSPLKYRKKHRR